MSFASLPPELQAVVVDDMSRLDLLSLCLVSKSTLHLARPHLYHSITLRFQDQAEQLDCIRRTSSWLVTHWGVLSESRREEAEEEIEWRQTHFIETERRTRCLTRTLRQNPQLAEFVKEAHIGGNQPIENLPRAQQILDIFASLKNLRTLCIDGAVLDTTKRDSVFSVFPTALLTSLVLSPTRLPSLPFIELLRQTPLLEYLKVLREEEDIVLDPSTFPRLPHLKQISLSGASNYKHLLPLLTSSTDALGSLDIPCTSLPHLKLNALSSLRHLEIVGVPESHRLAQLLCDTLRSCPRLVSFRSFLTESPVDPEAISSLQDLDVLSFLPSTLRKLSTPITFTPRYFLHFVTNRSTKTPLELLLPTFDAKEDMQAMEKVSEERNVTLEWFD